MISLHGKSVNSTKIDTLPKLKLITIIRYNLLRVVKTYLNTSRQTGQHKTSKKVSNTKPFDGKILKCFWIQFPLPYKNSLTISDSKRETQKSIKHFFTFHTQNSEPKNDYVHASF